ncbi:N-acetyl-1-D-myo-inositol-2-amino-2-deoxy-alpha-D-glucopyranoside deacetylase [Okibacterium sp. HSC-33S16]|uniref:PIG-L family deacetylase n=1 Tax=Okibacterium sp. HSC-33S16 TaxID=2910965 RepID=UPI0020A1CF7A|nr:PIG-L family deacetylase [Okibacterium sp. HSC-33S16]MCP2031097.1 N-acetyl-1-D-myo-inositol-2-amino-2-deoxy-alpha-D-glucopyranoside deacetylase [Okibacterium sp. HSC-33S16]
MTADLLTGVRSVLFAHAHPDDETLASGGLIAELVARGIHVTLLTASRGERGEVVAGPLSHLAGTEALSIERERELAGALDVLGITEHYWLGTPPARAAGQPERHYRDSGMVWVREGVAGPADDAATDALARAELADVTADVAALLRTTQPDLVISYDDHGGYGHPDHVRIREAAVRASAQTGIPFAELLDEPAPDARWFELEHRRTTMTDALRWHASQLTVFGDEVVHSGGQREAIRPSVGLRIVEAATISSVTDEHELVTER